MKKNFRIIFLTVLFYIPTTNATHDPFKKYYATMEKIRQTEEKFSHIFDMTKIKEMAEEDFRNALYCETKIEEKRHSEGEKYENIVPIKKNYIPHFTNPKQYLEPDEEGYINPYESKYNVYIIDTNPRLENIKLDSNSSESDSSISSDSVKKKKIKIPKYKRITVLETEKIISIHRARFQKLVNIFNKSPRWSVAKMFNDPEIGIAIEEYIEEYINKKICNKYNGTKSVNHTKHNNYNKIILRENAKLEELKTAREEYNELVDKINNMITECKKMPNMQEDVNNISVHYKVSIVDQQDIKQLRKIFYRLKRGLDHERINQKVSNNSNMMLNKKRLMVNQ